MAKTSPIPEETSMIVALVSRRAAGVWTHLTSLSVCLGAFSQIEGPLLWIDLGRRFEMLNHLGLDPADFPPESSLLGLTALMALGEPVGPENLVEYGAYVIAGWQRNQSAVLGSEYARMLLESTSRNPIYMVPLGAPAVQALSSGIDAQATAATIRALIASVRPSVAFLTCQGQPEAELFARAVEEDELLRSCMDVSQLILSMVRFDSRPRFRDSVAVPAILARDETRRAKLKVILSRAAGMPAVPGPLQQHVVGYLPFAAFIDESVGGGRIPMLDLWVRRCEGTASDLDQEYESCIRTVGRVLAPDREGCD